MPAWGLPHLTRRASSLCARRTTGGGYSILFNAKQLAQRSSAKAMDTNRARILAKVRIPLPVLPFSSFIRRCLGFPWYFFILMLHVIDAKTISNLLQATNLFGLAAVSNNLLTLACCLNYNTQYFYY